MQKPEADPRLVEEIVHYFNEKKRLTIKGYLHKFSKADEKLFNDAALLCSKYELDPASFIEMLYERMGGKKNFFNPSCLQGTAVDYFLKEQTSGENTYKVEITNITIDPADIWEQQMQLAQLYMRKGENIEDILMNSSLKFFAWFRILCTPNRITAVIDKYVRIARKEINQKIIDFAKSAGLDIHRII